MEPVEEFRKAMPDRIIPSLMVSENELTLPNFDPHSEYNPLPTNNYLHFQENLSQSVPLFAFAAENGVPIGIHLGIGPPDVAYDFTPDFNANLANHIELEPVLQKYPDLKIYLMHAGYPMLDGTLAMMDMYPQVYLEIETLRNSRSLRQLAHQILHSHFPG